MRKHLMTTSAAMLLAMTGAAFADMAVSYTHLTLPTNREV